jgi:hypothetical protein
MRRNGPLMVKAPIKIRFRKSRDLWEVDYRDAAGQRPRPLFATEEEAHQHAAELFKTLGQGVDP